MDGWVWERTEQDAPLAAGRFAADGMRLVTVQQPTSADLRETQAALAAALRLPSPAERNLDTFADALRDLSVWWKGQTVALVWEGAGLLREADEPAWQLLAGLLDGAQVPTIAVVGSVEPDLTQPPTPRDGEV
ncbi:barstar family protein [Ornithinimicrobium sufpigmenti]|uniref:barstar family protein n=1 Tax=Ornithinimicrobium sufpigmenti TaxID=2508882 RepID=UPI00103611F3|nr:MULTISPECIES: barstar family protein [unclassified Ornithinimicrobium]